MEFRELHGYIEKLNNKNLLDEVVTEELSNNVHFLKIYEYLGMKNGIRKFEEKAYNIYFILDNKKKYIGAVVLMPTNLMWYMLPEFRKEGYLKNALIEFIIPHILLTKDEQIISVEVYNDDEESFQASNKLAISVGFKLIEEKSNSKKSKIYYKIEKCV